VTTEPVATAEIAAAAPACDPIAEVRDLLAAAIELAAVDLKCDTRSAALFVIHVLLRTPALAPPTVH
jgi:hypothetical protein